MEAGAVAGSTSSRRCERCSAPVRPAASRRFLHNATCRRLGSLGCATCGAVGIAARAVTADDLDVRHSPVGRWTPYFR